MESTYSVLLVDNDDINNFINKRIIKKLNICNQIDIVKNGLDALKYVVEFSPKDNICPQLILLDLEMPVMDGIQFLQSFNELIFSNKEKVKIILLSAIDSSKYADKLKEYPVHSFITKPLTEEKMIDVFKKEAQYCLQ